MLPPVMDQVALTFMPGVLIVRTGHPVDFRNSDDMLHNVRVNEDSTKAGTFNVAIPMGEDYRFTFEREGFYNVGCDIHPAMSATIYASPSPYATMSNHGRSVRRSGMSRRGVCRRGRLRRHSNGSERPVEVSPARTELEFTQLMQVGPFTPGSGV